METFIISYLNDYLFHHSMWFDWFYSGKWREVIWLLKWQWAWIKAAQNNCVCLILRARQWVSCSVYTVIRKAVHPFSWLTSNSSIGNNIFNRIAKCENNILKDLQFNYHATNHQTNLAQLNSLRYYLTNCNVYMFHKMIFSNEFNLFCTNTLF